jgi:hypothetical protein
MLNEVMWYAWIMDALGSTVRCKNLIIIHMEVEVIGSYQEEVSEMIMMI